jgi:hypothetical protein
MKMKYAEAYKIRKFENQCCFGSAMVEHVNSCIDMCVTQTEIKFSTTNKLVIQDLHNLKLESAGIFKKFEFNR